MTRFKKILIAGLMILVSCFTYLGSAISNFAQSIFSFGKASAATSTKRPGNVNSDNISTIQGDILTIPALPTDGKVKSAIEIPFGAVTSKNVGGSDTTDTNKLFVEIIDPLGQSLTMYDDSKTNLNATVSNDGSVVISYTSDTGVITLTPNYAGVYKVIYHTLSQEGIWSSSYENKIVVTSESYAMSFMSNDSIVMPNIVKTYDQDSQQNESAVDIAIPLLYDRDGNLIEEEVLLSINGENYAIKFENLTNVKLSDVSDVNSSIVFANYKTYTIKKADADTSQYNYSLSIDVTNGSENPTINSVDSIADTAVVYQKNAFSFVAKNGNNNIDYVLNEKGGAYLSSTRYVVEGDSEYSVSDVELVANPSSTLTKTSVSYYTKTDYLPSVSAIDKNNNNSSVNAFYYYTIKGVDDKDNEIAGAVELGRDENGFYFIPKIEGDFEIYYNVLDFYGNKVDEKNDNNNYYDVTVTDRLAPDFHYVNSFDHTNMESADLTDISYMIPNKVQLSSDNENPTKIVIPAVWAQDQGEGDEKDVANLYRYIKATSTTMIAKDGESTKNVAGTIYFNNDSGETKASDFTLPDGVTIQDLISFEELPDGYVMQEDGTIVNNNESEPVNVEGKEARNLKSSKVAVLNLDTRVFKAGEYTLVLYVSDGSYGNTNSRTFTFEVVDSSEEFTETRPTVKFGNLTVGDITDNQNVSIAVPSVKDDVDTKLLTKYYVVVDDKYVQVNTSEDGKYISFNTSDLIDETNSIYQTALSSVNKRIEVVAYSFNDYANYAIDEATLINDFDENDEQFNGIGRNSIYVSLKNNNSDNLAPSFNDFGENSAKPTQNQEYTINEFTFFDNTDKVDVDVKIEDTNGNLYSYQYTGSMKVENQSSVGGAGYDYKFTVPGIKFTPTNADKDNYYTVTYILKDKGNNVTTYSYVLLQPTDTTPPVITGFDGEEKEIELGQTLYIEGIKVSDNQAESSSINLTITTKYNGNILLKGAEAVSSSSIKFTPDKVGTYVLEVTANDGLNDSEARTITINVVDTIKPEIIVNGSTNISPISESTLSAIEGDNIWEDESVQITLPTFSVVDYFDDNGNKLPNSMSEVSGKITITTPNADDKTITATTYEYNLNGTFIGDEKDNHLNFRIENGNYVFSPFARGEYKITYSGSDGTNSVELDSFSVDVGSTHKPNIYLTDAFKSILNKGFILDENITLRINKKAYINGQSDSIYSEDGLCIRVSDDYGFNFETFENENGDEVQYVIATIKITAPDGTTISPTETDGDINVYDLSQVGTYKLSITVTNKLNKSRTLDNVTFEVKAKDTPVVDSTAIVTTIVIVVAVVGVSVFAIVFFSKKSKQSKSTKSNKTIKKD